MATVGISLGFYEQQRVLNSIWEVMDDIRSLKEKESDNEKKEKLDSILSILESVEEDLGF